MPTYGRTFTLSGAKNTVNAPASGGGKAGDFTKESGFLAYYEVNDSHHLKIYKYLCGINKYWSNWVFQFL